MTSQLDRDTAKALGYFEAIHQNHPESDLCWFDKDGDVIGGSTPSTNKAQAWDLADELDMELNFLHKTATLGSRYNFTTYAGDSVNEAICLAVIALSKEKEK